MQRPRFSNFMQRICTGITLGALFWTSLVFLPPLFFNFVLIGILACIIFFEWQQLFPNNPLAFWLLMPLYPILPFILLMLLNNNPLYRSLLFILFILVSSFDTGSYFVGSLIGRTKIAPRISPSKSWEGVIGGCLFAYIGLMLVLWELHAVQPWWIVIPFTLLICLLSLSGDLFESWLKRRAQVKDSGNLLPGHGGFLDRFDGILFTIFFFYWARDWLALLFKLHP